MQRHTGERGAALILLIGITAALAILATAAVMVLANQQGATANDRSDKTSLYYAEAGLDSAVTAVKGKTISQTAAFVTASELAANYTTAYPSAPALTTRVYDDATVVDANTPAYDQNRDTKVWVEVQVTYQGQKTRLRKMVGQTTTPNIWPKAALFSDANISASSGSGDVYAVNPDGTPDTSGPPYQTSVMARGNFTGNWSTNLAAPGSSVQSLGINVNGTVSLPGIVENGIDTTPVPPLSSYFNSTSQAQYETQAKAGMPTKANPYGTVVSAALLTQLQARSSVTYNAATDLVVNGNLKLSGGESWFNFKSLYVTGDLTLNGNTHTNCTSLYVGGNFTISGPSGTSKFGPIYVGGKVNWGGQLSVQTADYTDASKAPGPVYVVGDFIVGGGPYSHVLGPTWVQGTIPITDHAIDISGNASQILCPLMATTERIRTSGSLNFGTLAQPMILYMVCDNDGLYTNTCLWGSNGTFTGLMVLMEAGINLPGGNGSQTDFVGAIFSIKDITFGGNTGVCYNQTVIDNLSNLTSTTSTSQIPGTWQELSPN